MKHVFCICFILFSCWVLGAQNQQLFEDANRLYNEGKYAEAIDKYMAILETEHHSPELYFNLANAHYKLNNVAPSVFYYEKALQLAPKDEDIKNNLGFAQNMTIDAIDNVPEVGFSKLIKNLTNTFSFDTWAILAVLMVCLYVILFLIYYFSHSSLKKRITFIASNICLLAMCIALAFAFNKYEIDKKDNPAIVFAQETKVKTEPNNRSEEAFRLHEGTKVQILDTVNNWKQIQLTDGKTGWIPAEDIRMLTKN
ncbi:tetratricopeptide repeat protein [Hyunsoonleella sp. SJ7]|uniref:Tetratricopeptide repeat protein n=1 Tax=Hyunsoonleella aquatilis TaxID=2762758 RepID=A0A923H9K3_9FLAO|nr:tetratricopeptide repeat protein [Hyunsoonleella aquatilis]MBC3759826.1 tetratricopeptide repeat protein [Hyunsoonleella aquatilis]